MIYACKGRIAVICTKRHGDLLFILCFRKNDRCDRTADLVCLLPCPQYDLLSVVFDRHLFLDTALGST